MICFLFCTSKCALCTFSPVRLFHKLDSRLISRKCTFVLIPVATNLYKSNAYLRNISVLYNIIIYSRKVRLEGWLKKKKY